MCIIILSKEGKLPDKEKLRVAHLNNPDGFGVMWVADGRVKTKHGLFTFDQVWTALKTLEGIPWCMHLRYVTRGSKTLTQCHPFQVSSKDLNGRDIWMVHNGTFMFLKKEKERSDTQAFASNLFEVLRGKKNPDEVLFSEYVQTNMKKKIESWNRMVFLTDEGRFEIFNQEAGLWLDDSTWASNDYSFDAGHRLPKYKTPAAHELDRHLLSQGNGSRYRLSPAIPSRVSNDGFKGYVTRRDRKLQRELDKVNYDPRFKWSD